MGHSKAEKAESRERILSAAARGLREDGLAGVSIAELMRAAGLTHGGFYGHFASRDALLAAALDRALAEGAEASQRARGAPVAEPRRPAGEGEDAFAALVRTYLAPAHRDAAGRGCALPALAAEAARAGGDVQAVMRDHLDRFVAATAALLGEEPAARERALAAWCTMVGAVTLARLAGGGGEGVTGGVTGDEVLRAARHALLDAPR